MHGEVWTVGYAAQDVGAVAGIHASIAMGRGKSPQSAENEVSAELHLPVKQS